MALPNVQEINESPASEQADGLAALIARAKQTGFVTPEEIDELFVSQDMSPEQLDAVYITLQQAGIEIVEEDEDDEPLFEFEPEVIVETVPVEEAPSPTADPVRMYLKSIGKVPLL